MFESRISFTVTEDDIQHNPMAADARDGLLGFVDYLESLVAVEITLTRVLAEGNLVMVLSAKPFGGDKVMFDLFRVEIGQIAEHWDVIQTIPAEIAHENGIF